MTKTEIDLLKSRVAKQRHEIGRLSHALERCAEEKRLRALAHAATHGVSAAAHHFSISRQSIHNWRRTLKESYK